MTTYITKVKDGVIALPKELCPAWENADVYITSEKGHISIKRLNSPSFGVMLDEMTEAGKSLTEDDLDEALRLIRKE